MHLKRYFVEGRAHASYLFGADGEAAVVDPKRDVEDYLADATAAGLKIVAVLNTHPHADFASGFREIAERTGAKLYTSHLAPVKYDRVPARDGQRRPTQPRGKTSLDSGAGTRSSKVGSPA